VPFVFGSFHISRSLKISNTTPFQKKHKMEIPTMVKENRNVSGNEIKMTLEDYFALDNG
jgi:hypothetical protein